MDNKSNISASRTSLVFYGIGNISPAIKGNFLGAPIFFYYNNVLGLEAWLVSLALAIALIIDGITDPLVGYLSDYTNSRWGRRHPYIYASILPGSLFYFLLITLNLSNTQLGIFIQLLVLITLLRVAWTLYQVPREALGAEISKDYNQRTQLHGLSSFFGWIGGAGIAYLTLVLLGDSYSNIDGYHELAIWGSLLILFSGLIFAIGTSRDIPSLEAPTRAKPKNIKSIIEEIKETLNHKSWLMLFFAGIVFSIYVGLTSGLGFYFNSFFWDWKPTDVKEFIIVDLFAALIISAFAGKLAQRFDKKRLAVNLFILSIAIGPLLLILRLADIWWGISILPANGEKFGSLWWIMLTHSFVQASVGVLAWILVGSMTADIVEDSQRQTGKRSEGLFFAGPHLAQKAVSGIGLMIKGVMLTAVGFVATNSLEAKIAAMQDLAGIIVILSIIMPSISLFLLSRYELTQSSHQANLTDLGYVRAKDDPTG